MIYMQVGLGFFIELTLDEALLVIKEKEKEFIRLFFHIENFLPLLLNNFSFSENLSFGMRKQAKLTQKSIWFEFSFQI